MILYNQSARHIEAELFAYVLFKVENLDVDGFNDAF